jgi:hypothetical protein
MIGIRPLASAAVALLGLAIGLGPGGPRPDIAVAADRLIAHRAGQADAALGALRERLAPVLDAARRGAARVVAGDERPGPELDAAATGLLAAQDDAIAARSARGQLEAARRASAPDAPDLPGGPDPADVASIAGQLQASAEAGELFAAARRAAAHVAVALDEALAALDREDLDGAAAAVRAARSDHDAVVAAGITAVTLPVWSGTTDAMIAAVEDIVAATERGDAAAAQEAAAAFAALGDDAVIAERALQIAISEAGGAVAATPLARLAHLLADIDELRVAIAPLRPVGTP